MDLVYVTGNKYKIEVAKNNLEPFGFNIIQKVIDCPEIQDDEIEKVSQFSAKYAANALNMPVIKNDCGFIIPALNGFPGAYAKYAEHTLGEDGLLKLMQGKENRYCYFLEVVSYCEPNGEPVSFFSKTEGEITHEKRGTDGIGYDYIFIPKGYSQTLAELDPSQTWKVWEPKALIDLKDYLLSKK